MDNRDDLTPARKRGRAIRAWNSGLTLEEAMTHCYYGPWVKPFFIEFEQKYQEATIPLKDIIPMKHNDKEDESYLIWKGDIGPGAMLRKMIQKMKASGT